MQVITYSPMRETWVLMGNCIIGMILQGSLVSFSLLPSTTRDCRPGRDAFTVTTRWGGRLTDGQMVPRLRENPQGCRESWAKTKFPEARWGVHDGRIMLHGYAKRTAVLNGVDVVCCFIRDFEHVIVVCALHCGERCLSNAMINQYMGVVPSSFQVLYFCNIAQRKQSQVWFMGTQLSTVFLTSPSKTMATNSGVKKTQLKIIRNSGYISLDIQSYLVRIGVWTPKHLLTRLLGLPFTPTHEVFWGFGMSRDLDMLEFLKKYATPTPFPQDLF